MSSEIQKQFVLTSKIGNGNFSTVYLAKHIETQQIVAIKTMKNHIPIALKQAQILKKLNHPNIIKLYKFQTSKTKEQALIVLEYLPQNILQLYETQQYGLKQQQVKCILFQVCLGFYHIHQKGIIHRDIKPQNIMINRNKAEVKLIDFGLAIQQNQCITDYVATRWYRAPQNLLGTKQYTVAIDIFSLGCVIVELYTGNPLFPGSNNIDQISKILTLMGEPTPQSWRKGYEMFLKLGINFHIKSEKKRKTLKNLMTSCSEGLIILVQKMLVLNPQKRITAQQILKDPYFNDIQKMIPPHVYEQFLTDIKHNRTSFVKEVPKIDSKVNDKQQRIRFLSQEKGFGAFSSFKPSLASNKLQNMIKVSRRLNQKASNTKNQFKKYSFLQTEQNRSKNKSIKNIKDSLSFPSFKENFVTQLDQNKQTNASGRQEDLCFLSAEVTSSIKNSIQNYQKNLLKLSASLQNMKSLNKIQMYKNQTKTALKQISKQNCKSSEMLTFRGFNQPKQKFPSWKQKQSSSFLVKRNQSLKHFPVKSKKVIEYLQKFQNFPHKKQDQNHISSQQKKQQEFFLHQSLNIDNKSPKKSSFLGDNSINKSFLSKKTQQKKANYDNRANFEENHRLLHKKQNSFESTEQLKKNDSFSFIKLNHELINQQKQQNQLSRPKIDSPSIERSHRGSFIKKNESPSKQRDSSFKVKFNQPNSQKYIFGNNLTQTSSNKLIVSNQVSQNFTSKNTLYGSNKFVPIKSKEDFKDFHYFSYNNQNATRLSNNNNILNVSENRPIENKMMKIISFRESIPCEQIESQALKQSISNYTFINSDKQKTIKSPFKSQFNFNQISNLNKSQQKYTNAETFNYSTFYSPRRNDQMSFQSPPKYIPAESMSNPYLNQEHSKMKYSQPLNYLQTSKEFQSPPRYSFKSSQFEARNDNSRQLNSIDYRNNHFTNAHYQNSTQGRGTLVPSHQYSISELHEQKRLSQKPSQTTLSQLRQSITGLTKSLNEGAFLSEKAEKFTNKNININLNLNIYEQKSNRKK